MTIVKDRLGVYCRSIKNQTSFTHDYFEISLQPLFALSGFHQMNLFQFKLQNQQLKICFTPTNQFL